MQFLLLLNNVLLKIKKKIEKLQTHDLGFFIGKNYFSKDES